MDPPFAALSVRPFVPRAVRLVGASASPRVSVVSSLSPPFVLGGSGLLHGNAAFVRTR